MPKRPPDHKETPAERDARIDAEHAGIARMARRVAPVASKSFGEYSLLRGVLDNYRKAEGNCPICGTPFNEHTDGQLIRCANMEVDPRCQETP